MTNTYSGKTEFALRRWWGPVPTYPKVESYENTAHMEAIINERLLMLGGPCSVESADQIHAIAQRLGRLKVQYLRGGIYRAGTYPNRSRGFGLIDETLIAEFARAAHENGMKTVVEVLEYSPQAMAIYDKYGDAYQVGARQMQNYPLLKMLSQRKRPVFLKRAVGATIDEFLGSAEWLLQNGTCDVILIERGSATNATHVRWDLSISMIPAIGTITNLPVLVDASHGTGRRDLVIPMTLAGVAAGAAGCLFETHPQPRNSISDADQAISIEDAEYLVTKARDIQMVLRNCSTLGSNQTV